MLDIYLQSTNGSDIENLGAFSVTGDVNITYSLDGKKTVPNMINIVSHEGASSLHARFNDVTDAGVEIEIDSSLRNLGPSVSGTSKADRMLTFSFAEGSERSDWKDATGLIAVGA